MKVGTKNTITMARQTHEWFRARPGLLDMLFIVLIALLALADLFGEPVTTGPRDLDLFGVLLVVIGAASLWWRRVAPIPVLAFVVATSCVIYFRDYGSYAAAIGIAALYSVAAHEVNRRRAWIALGVSYTVLFAVASATLLNGVDGHRWSNGLSMTLTIGATILAGAVIRNKEEIFADTQERAERAEADRQAEAERAVIRERLRIAREMHDVVAHGMSLITVQAATASEIATSRPEDAARLMRSVESTGRDALSEMRRMLGVLRNDDSSDPSSTRRDLAPQPSLIDLDAVVAHCVAAGIPTELIIGGVQRPLQPGIELAAFRIVQEALTNVVKHGGDAATASVEVDYNTDELTIRVSDTGRGAVSELSGAGQGHGLLGMKERVEIYGGELDAGPRTGGGYQVEVSLPIRSMTQPPVSISLEEEGASSL